jgi:hypothetical protein
MRGSLRAGETRAACVTKPYCGLFATEPAVGRACRDAVQPLSAAGGRYVPGLGGASPNPPLRAHGTRTPPRFAGTAWKTRSAEDCALSWVSASRLPLSLHQRDAGVCATGAAGCREL